MFESLKFAPLDEVWSPRGISATIENPYKPREEVVEKVTPVIEDACHRYLEDVYDSQGVRGLLKVLDPYMVRDIQALAHPVQRSDKSHRNETFSLSLDELILIAFGIFAIILATE